MTEQNTVLKGSSHQLTDRIALDSLDIIGHVQQSQLELAKDTRTLASLGLLDFLSLLSITLQLTPFMAILVKTLILSSKQRLD